MGHDYEPSEEELQRRRRVGVNAETVTHVTSTDFPGHWPHEDHSWSVENFSKNFQVDFHEIEDSYSCCFSLIGLDASIANAFRRILLAEVPTLAIEEVFVFNNTSIVQDEVLAQRLGLVPLKGNKAGLKRLTWAEKPSESNPAPTRNEFNCVNLRLKVECTLNENAKKGETDPTKLYNNAHVYASDLEFEPHGSQSAFFPEPDGVVAPVNTGILLAKLRPGQALDLTMKAMKGIGADHAKFSPVATASYRLLPTIDIRTAILGNDAEKFARCFPRGVIGLELVTAEEASQKGSEYEGYKGQKKAVVRDTFKDTVSRECLRHDEFKDKVKLGRVRDHFIFSVESTGQFESDELFLESVKVLRMKCEQLQKMLPYTASN